MKKIIWLIAILAVSALTYFGYATVKNRYAAPTKEGQTETSNKNSLDSQQTQSSVEEENKFPQETQDSQETIPTETIPENSASFLDVTRQDCDEKCKKFTKDSEDLKYCQEFCGLANPKKNSTDCDSLEGLDTDYCLKDQAIAKNDFKICEKILDSNIKKTCKNRLLEDVLEKAHLE